MPIAATRHTLDDVFSATYEELRRLAGSILGTERGASATPTTLVNEAWLKLAHSPAVAGTSPLHFRRIAGRAMRQVLVDSARRRYSSLHGGGQVRVAFDDALGLPAGLQNHDVLALDAALELLAGISPRQALLVDAHFFGGYSFGECAVLLDVSEATVMRDWRTARAWLARAVRQDPDREGAATQDASARTASAAR